MARERGLTWNGRLRKADGRAARPRSRRAEEEDHRAFPNRDQTPTKFVGYDRSRPPRTCWKSSRSRTRPQSFSTPPPLTPRWAVRSATRARSAAAGQLWRVAEHAEERQHLAAFHRSRRRSRPPSGTQRLLRAWNARAGARSSATTPSRICCTGRCTKSSARRRPRKVPSSGRTS